MQIHRVQKAISTTYFLTGKHAIRQVEIDNRAGADGRRGNVPAGLRGVGDTPSPPSLPPHKLGSDDVPACTPWSLTDLIAYHPQSIN